MLVHRKVMGKLQENLELLKSTRATTLSLVRGLPQESLDWSPQPDQWSLGEVLDHLVRSAELYRKETLGLVSLARQGKTPFVRKTVQEIDFAPNFLPKSMLPVVDIPFTVMTMFVPQAMRDLMIRYSGVLKGQTPEVARPAKGRPAAELIGELEKSLAETIALIRDNPKLNWERMAIQHPLLGVNNVPQILRLTTMHEKRHQDQMRGLLAALPAVAATA
jgi:hypothetical protein